MSTSEEELAVVLDYAPFKTRDEFVRWWLDGLIYHADNEAERDVVLQTMNLEATECDCREPHCRGWRMTPTRK